MIKRKKWLPDGVTEYRDRHGKKRYRFRRTGYRTHHFKHEPGTEAFRTEYALCKDEKLVPGEDKVVPGTFDDLITRYYRSPDFLNPGDRTRVVYRGTIERWREGLTKSGNRHGSAKVEDLTASRVGGFMSDMLPYRTAANMLRKRLNALMDFAVREGMAKTNPVKSTKPFTVDSAGFHAWTEAEIDAYEAQHKVGTRARLAFDLLLWTGQRGGDVRQMGSGHILGARFVVTQEKTGATVRPPLLKPLSDSIAATETGADYFLVTRTGKPFTRKGFGNWFRECCDEAGLTHCSAHGLRKAAARRFAETGSSNQEIKSWTGHTTDAEVSRYTASASAETLSDAAGKRLMERHGKSGSGEPTEIRQNGISQGIENA